MTDYHVSDSMLAIMESDEVTGSGFDQERRREVERMMARELRLLRAEVDFERKRVWTLIEEKDVVPGDDFRKQMAFDRERYEGACKRADQLREIGNNHAVNTQRERRRAEAAEVEVERLKKNAVRNWPLEMAMVEGDRDHWKARALKAEAKS